MTNWTFTVDHNPDVQATPASGPGALAGWTFTCPRPRCTERWGSTMRTQTDAHARAHGQWHDSRDRAAQPFSS